MVHDPKTAPGRNSFIYPERNVEVLNITPLVTMESIFNEVWEDGVRTFHNSSIMFARPEERRSINLSLEDARELLNVLQGVIRCSEDLHYGDNDKPIVNRLGGMSASIGPRAVSVTRQGGMKMIIIESARLDWKKEDMSREDRVKEIECNRVRLKDVVNRLTEMLTQGFEFIRTGVLPDNVRQSRIGVDHIFYRHVKPNGNGVGLSRLTVLAYKNFRLPNNPVMVKLMSSNCCLSLLDDIPHDWETPQIIKVLKRIRQRVGEVADPFLAKGDFPHKRLFDEGEYEVGFDFNGYVCAVPNKRSVKIVVNYDLNPSDSKLSWPLYEIDTPDIVAALDELIEWYENDIERRAAK